MGWPTLAEVVPGGSFLGFVIVAVVAFFAIAWPYELGTFIAVQAGADNPSPARTAVGRILEVPWPAFLMISAVFVLAKHGERKQAAAAFHAPRATRGPGTSIDYHHGACTINHRTHDAAGRCYKG